MSNPIFIPKKIKVGFRERKGTYTGQLAYVIYYDARDKLRKELSWNNWRQKDIEPQDFDNTPTEGFVLNKKAGGYRSYWNTRATYCRVYDPRGFEFEITIDNLLYVLENTDCIRGKGLAGEFVYGWSGKDLLLMPTGAADYAGVKSVSDTVNSNTWLKGKDLSLGGTYLTNLNKQWVYLGRFDYWQYNWRNPHAPISKGKHYFFSESADKLTLQAIKSLTRRVISVVDSEPVANYAMLMDELETRREFSPVSRSELVPLTKQEVASASYWDLHYRTVINDRNSGLSITRYGKEYDVYLNRRYYRSSREYLTLDQLFAKYSLYKTVYYLANGKQLKE